MTHAPSLCRPRRRNLLRQDHRAASGVDLDVNEGEIVTLIGANGAGKSTLMMTIFGNPRARDGSIVFDGRDITQLPTHEIARLRIAQSPEGRRIFPRMTVLENLQMGATVAAPRISTGPGARLRAVPAAQAAHAPARRHAVGRRAADARHRPRADEPAAPAAARRTVARPRAADRAPDLRRHLATQPRDGLTVFLVEQNAYHALEARPSRLRHGQRPDHAVRHRHRNCWSGRRSRGLSRRRPA